MLREVSPLRCCVMSRFMLRKIETQRGSPVGGSAGFAFDRNSAPRVRRSDIILYHETGVMSPGIASCTMEGVMQQRVAGIGGPEHAQCVGWERRP